MAGRHSWKSARIKGTGEEGEDECLHPATRKKTHFHCLGAGGASQIVKGSVCQPENLYESPHFTPDDLSRLTASSGSWGDGKVSECLGKMMES